MIEGISNHLFLKGKSHDDEDDYDDDGDDDDDDYDDDDDGDIYDEDDGADDGGDDIEQPHHRHPCPGIQSTYCALAPLLLP